MTVRLVRYTYPKQESGTIPLVYVCTYPDIFVYNSLPLPVDSLSLPLTWEDP